MPSFSDGVRHKVGHSRQYQSKHHHEHHLGPFFEGPLNTTAGALHVGVHLYTEAVLNCRVGMLKDKTVSFFFFFSFRSQRLVSIFCYFLQTLSQSVNLIYYRYLCTQNECTICKSIAIYNGHNSRWMHQRNFNAWAKSIEWEQKVKWNEWTNKRVAQMKWKKKQTKKKLNEKKAKKKNGFLPKDKLSTSCCACLSAHTIFLHYLCVTIQSAIRMHLGFHVCDDRRRATQLNCVWVALTQCDRSAVEWQRHLSNE